MLNGKLIATVALVASMAIGGLTATADGPQTASRELVQYRLEKWKTTHAEPGEKGEQMIATLKKLRCEVKVSSHGGHSDVSYRCPKWQELSLKSHKEAHGWESWLKKLGFQTKHAH